MPTVEMPNVEGTIDVAKTSWREGKGHGFRWDEKSCLSIVRDMKKLPLSFILGAVEERVRGHPVHMPMQTNKIQPINTDCETNR